ncbi:MAG: hypothetical protein EPO39_01450 [Candidatus Manganitrophaceae bacterium]|nr:MAG: hypothetical protein EPO39_01450 [Candidatus Manganitrophaceae bacterium]
MKRRRTTLLSLILIFLIGWPIGSSAEAPDRLLNEGRRLLKEEQPAEALDRFDALIARRQHVAAALFGAAEASALLERPAAALGYYRQVEEAPDASDDEKRRASFGAARMLLWLERYPESESIYRRLLTAPLSEDDLQVARAGLIRALALQDQPIAAYRSVPEESGLDSSGRFERARAALWAGWPEKARLLLEGVDAPPGSRLAQEVETLHRSVAETLGHPLNARFYFSADNDDLQTRKTDLMIGRRFSGLHVLSVLFQNQHFSQRDRDLDMRGVQGRYDGQLGDALSVALQGGPAKYGDGWTPLSYGQLLYRPTDRFRVELGAGREAVETFAAFDRHITLTSASLGVDYNLTRRVALVGLLYTQRFSDGNDRQGGIAKTVVVLSEQIGLSAQARLRFFESGRDDVVGYFNPARFREEQLLLNLKRTLRPGWRLEALTGPGYQQISGGDHNVTWLVEGRLSARWTGCLSANALLGYTTSSVSTPSGFEMTYGQLFVSCPW